MGAFSFLKKDNAAGLSDREKYGQAWLQIVGQRNSVKGLQTMQALCNQGFIEGAIVLAMFTEDPSLRRALYKKAADQNHPEGLWGYSSLLDHSYIPDPDDPDDAKWEAYCLKAAQCGSVDAMNELGNVFNRRDQYPQSMYWYAMANANEIPDGQISMKGIARKWYNEGMPYGYEATAGFTEAKYKCAMCYLEIWAGQKITTPIDEYIRFTLSGEPLAAYLTGDLFEQAGNMEMAYKMYNASAHSNDAHGLKCYADMLYYGRGVKQDVQGAFRMYQLSAEKGDRSAMFVMGELTRKQNANMAAYWYGISHTRGYEHALQRLIQLAGK